jgi:hypothetical protein
VNSIIFNDKLTKVKVFKSYFEPVYFWQYVVLNAAPKQYFHIYVSLCPDRFCSNMYSQYALRASIINILT